MARGKYEAPGKNRWLPVVGIVVLLVLLAANNGVAAYLSHSSAPLTNEVVAQTRPVITVNDDHSITVDDPGYGVYLRAVVVINWRTAEGNILAEMPTGMTLTPGANWFLHTDGFYYYRNMIMEDHTAAPVITVSNAPDMEGCTLQITVVAQSVQAVGQTDGEDPVDAVYDAWGITTGEITGS